MFDKLLAAIVNDNQSAVDTLLSEKPELAKTLIEVEKLYQKDIFHWIYVGDTALHLAAAGYRTGIVQSLLKSGANANACTNRRNSSPLHYAADGYIIGPAWDAKLQVETIRILIDAGAMVNLKDKNGATPLHRAVRTRCAAAVTVLLELGANPVLRNKSGSTPFHLAVQNTGRGGSGDAIAKDAQQEIIKTFIANKVDSNLEDGTGKTVLECARSSWIIELLQTTGLH